MSQLVRHHLLTLVAQDPSIGDDARRCEALLRDLCRNQHKKEITALVTAVREGVVAELRDGSTGAPAGAKFHWLLRRLHDDCGLRKSVSRWTIETWAAAYGIPVSTGPESPPAPRHAQAAAVQRTPTEAQDQQTQQPAEDYCRSVQGRLGISVGLVGLGAAISFGWTCWSWWNHLSAVWAWGVLLVWGGFSIASLLSAVYDLHCLFAPKAGEKNVSEWVLVEIWGFKAMWLSRGARGTTWVAGLSATVGLPILYLACTSAITSKIAEGRAGTALLESLGYIVLILVITVVLLMLANLQRQFQIYLHSREPIGRRSLQGRLGLSMTVVVLGAAVSFGWTCYSCWNHASAAWAWGVLLVWGTFSGVSAVFFYFNLCTVLGSPGDQGESWDLQELWKFHEAWESRAATSSATRGARGTTWVAGLAATVGLPILYLASTSAIISKIAEGRAGTALLASLGYIVLILVIYAALILVMHVQGLIQRHLHSREPQGA